MPRWRDVQAAALAAPARAGDLADLARHATAWLGSAADYGSGGPARSMACSPGCSPARSHTASSSSPAHAGATTGTAVRNHGGARPDDRRASQAAGPTPARVGRERHAAGRRGTGTSWSGLPISDSRAFPRAIDTNAGMPGSKRCSHCLAKPRRSYHSTASAALATRSTGTTSSSMGAWSHTSRVWPVRAAVRSWADHAVCDRSTDLDIPSAEYLRLGRRPGREVTCKQISWF